MDALTLRLIQLIIVTLIGAVAIVFGFILFIKGISGKSTIIVSASDIKGKITNASPGVFLTIVGALAVYWSVNKDLTKQEKTKDTIVPGTSIDNWLGNVSKIDSSTGYTEMINTLVPTGDFVAKNIMIRKEMTLGAVADSIYHADKYWELLAAINKDRGYFTYSKVSAKTIVPKDNLVEYFVPTRFEHVRDRETLLKIRGKDIKAVYSILQNYTDTAKHIQSIESLRNIEKFIKDNYELSIAYKTEVSTGDLTLNELSMKYYGDKKFVGIIRGFNSDLPSEIKPNDSLKNNTELFIPFIIQ